MSRAGQGAIPIRYRCRACEHEFWDSLAGVVACPRCQSIADHEQVDHGVR